MNKENILIQKFMLNNDIQTHKRVIPDMQATTLQMPRDFIDSRMFRVPSDIMVVGPTDQTSSYKNNWLLFKISHFTNMIVQYNYLLCTVIVTIIFSSLPKYHA